MAGIAGIAEAGASARVNLMLDRIAHRGRHGRTVVEGTAGVWGAVWPVTQAASFVAPAAEVRDGAGAGHAAAARPLDDSFELRRDPLGVAPLYFGRTADGALCFASEVKAMLAVTDDVGILPPGSVYDGSVLKRCVAPPPPVAQEADPAALAAALRCHLQASVADSLCGEATGAWLSGGLDSSAIVALARPHVEQLHTFVAGLRDAPDVRFARDAAEYLRTTHHEVIVTLPELLVALPSVIYHLESFDALLVRSSLTNYLVAEAASDYVAEVLSGEGGDELFAGYEYLKALPQSDLPAELSEITGRLHNTALQRVDRCAAAHGLVAHVPFLSPAVVDYASAIPPQFKICSGVEKWILRQALQGLLPEAVRERPKAKFWQGTGVGEQLAAHAAAQVSDRDFKHERMLRNGWTLNSKEELFYYRIFRDHFGGCRSLDWMGRTKGAPVS